MIKQADGGTLFLDEIGELPHKIQKRFLRVLQERRFRPVGGNEEIESNFRLIAATNRNLAHMVEKEKFRKDLLFRLQSLTIELPSLREHSDDINELAKFHVARLCDRNHIETKSFSPDLLDALQAYNWPGNVRELVNTLEGALAVAGEDPILFSKHLPVHIRVHLARKSVDESKQNTPSSEADLDLSKPFPEFRSFRKSTEKDKNIKELCNLVFKGVPKSQMEKCTTLADLTRRLRQPQNNIGIALLTAKTKQDLEDLVALRELLSDIRVILILPDRDHDTISKAHALYPRFLTYIDRDFDEVKAVLSKMLFSLNLNKNYRQPTANN